METDRQKIEAILLSETRLVGDTTRKLKFGGFDSIANQLTKLLTEARIDEVQRFNDWGDGKYGDIAWDDYTDDRIAELKGGE